MKMCNLCNAEFECALCLTCCEGNIKGEHLDVYCSLECEQLMKAAEDLGRTTIFSIAAFQESFRWLKQHPFDIDTEKAIELAKRSASIAAETGYGYLKAYQLNVRSYLGLL